MFVPVQTRVYVHTSVVVLFWEDFDYVVEEQGRINGPGSLPSQAFQKKTYAVQATKQCKICSHFQRILIIGFYIINLNTKSMTPFPVVDNPTGDFYWSDRVWRFDYERRQIQWTCRTFYASMELLLFNRRATSCLGSDGFFPWMFWWTFDPSLAWLYVQ